MNETKEKQEYRIGDSVTIDYQEWIVAEELNGDVILYRDSVDGHSNTMKYAKKDLPEKDEYR